MVAEPSLPSLPEMSGYGCQRDLVFEGKDPDVGGVRGSVFHLLVLSIVRTRSRRSWSARASPGELVLALGP